MACFSKESGSWGDCCVAFLGATCLLVAVLASAFTVAQWQRNQAAYRWTHCSVQGVKNASWVECPTTMESSRPDLGSADLPGLNTSFPCIRVMVRYMDETSNPRIGVLHPNISMVWDQDDQQRCSIRVCEGSTTRNEDLVRQFTDRWRDVFGHFICYVNKDIRGEVFETRPHTSRALEVVVLFAVVICVICTLTSIVRCRCVYLNAREARSCIPSMSFFITSSIRSLQALLWTIAYKLFDWKLQGGQGQTLSSNDTQGLVEQFREERDDVDPCLPAASMPRSPSVGYSQPRPNNNQTYTPLACPPSDIRLWFRWPLPKLISRSHNDSWFNDNYILKGMRPESEPEILVIFFRKPVFYVYPIMCSHFDIRPNCFLLRTHITANSYWVLE